MENVWDIKDVIYPYTNKKTIHFEGFFPTYNYQAYVMVPGYFYILDFLSKKKSFLVIFTFLILSFFIFFIVKSKILFLLILFTFYYFFNKYINFNNLFFKFVLLFTTCLYFLISHFLISTEPLLSESYNFYFTSEPLVKINNIFIYGSLFYKFKIAVLNNIEQISFLPTGIVLFRL